jgi:LPS-assembly lipoprotein
MRRLVATIQVPTANIGCVLLALLLLSLGLTGGCGWHLRGAARLPTPLLSIYIDTDDRYSTFYRELRSGLVASGAQVQSTVSAANAIVRITTDQTGQGAPSVSAYNKPEQFVVFYRIEYSVAVAGKEVIPSQPLALSASYSYDANAVLAKQREQFDMQQALARDLANQVLRRLAAVDTAPAAQ